MMTCCQVKEEKPNRWTIQKEKLPFGNCNYQLKYLCLRDAHGLHLMLKLIVVRNLVDSILTKNTKVQHFVPHNRVSHSHTPSHFYLHPSLTLTHFLLSSLPLLFSFLSPFYLWNIRTHTHTRASGWLTRSECLSSPCSCIIIATSCQMSSDVCVCAHTILLPPSYMCANVVQVNLPVDGCFNVHVYSRAVYMGKCVFVFACLLSV